MSIAQCGVKQVRRLQSGDLLHWYLQLRAQLLGMLVSGVLFTFITEALILKVFAEAKVSRISISAKVFGASSNSTKTVSLHSKEIGFTACTTTATHYFLSVWAQLSLSL